MDRFFVGLHQPADAAHIPYAMISVVRLCPRDKETGRFVRRRDGSLKVRRAPIPGYGEIMIDAGAFTQLDLHGHYPEGPEVYAEAIGEILPLAPGRIVAVVSQDYMCERRIFARRLEKTGRRYTIADHQAATIERYDALLELLRGRVYLMPVLQGQMPEHYLSHIEQYGARLPHGAWVGVGSVCKRNGNPREIAAVLRAIHRRRPDLKLHGFGCKTTALSSAEVREYLDTADSLAWSFNARKQRRAGDLTRNPNSWREALRFAERHGGPAHTILCSVCDAEVDMLLLDGRELEQAAQALAWGVCPICTSPLPKAARLLSFLLRLRAGGMKATEPRSLTHDHHQHQAPQAAPPS